MFRRCDAAEVRAGGVVFFSPDRGLATEGYCAARCGGRGEQRRIVLSLRLKLLRRAGLSDSVKWSARNEFNRQRRYGFSEDFFRLGGSAIV